MVDIGSMIISPCCIGFEAEVILIMPDPQTDEDICLLKCDNPDCMTSYGGVFTGMGRLPLAAVQEQLNLLMVPAEAFLAEVTF